jgi:hypothetical protein
MFGLHLTLREKLYLKVKERLSHFRKRALLSEEDDELDDYDEDGDDDSWEEDFDDDGDE